MLIVIVIIGILIAALMPRMQSAQGRARDVARKNDLSQLQTAIVTSQQDKWGWPALDSWAKQWMAISWISTELMLAWMSSVPGDPLWTNEVTWLWTSGITAGQYGYLVTKRNWTSNWWFVLMAKTEIEWWSNWIVCSWASSLLQWKITNNDDIKDIRICTKMVKNNPSGTCQVTGGVCSYNLDWELRYIVVY